MEIKPNFVRVSPCVGSVFPFLEEGESIPAIEKNLILGRIVYAEPAAKLRSSHDQFWVCDDKDYSLETVHQKNRSILRRAINSGALIKKISWDEFEKFKIDIVLDTFQRQGRSGFHHYIDQIDSLKKIDKEKWGGLIEIYVVQKGEDVGAAAICIRRKSIFYILHQMSFTSHLIWGANHYITFGLTKREIVDKGNTVNYGLRGYDNEKKISGLDSYKQRMGFTLMPAKVNFAVNKFYVIPFYFFLFIVNIVIILFPYFNNYKSLRLFKLIFSDLNLTLSKALNKFKGNGYD